MIGTSCPSTRPMRRLKNGITSSFEAEAERKDVAALEKERALLREEQREARQVRAARVDFGLGEVGVDGQRGEHVRAEPLRDVEARLKLAVDVGVRRGNAAAGRDRRTHGQADAEIEVRQIGEQAGAAGLRDLVLARRERPAIGLEPPLNAALHVEVPLAQIGIEAERLDRNQDLGAPARRVRCVAASQMPSQSALSLSPPGSIRPS